ncbi:MAG: VanW family protein [Candidatus Margulisbacteria bacterium]|nr:VanW family protein [Candidatus Margulisiibacteriota bacterium]
MLKILWVFAVGLLLAATSLVTYDYLRTRDAFPPGTRISGVEVSLLSQEQAINKLKKQSLDKIFAPFITLETDQKKFSFPPDKLGVFILYSETVDKAFALTHKGNYFEQLRSRISDGQINSPLILGIDDDQLIAILEALAEEIRSTPKDAAITYYEKTGGFNIKSDDPGRTLNLKRSIVRFKVRLYNGEKVIPLVIDYSRPKVTEKELREHPPAYQLSAYTTYYGSHDNPNRIHNIKLVASWLDGTLMMPGDILSVADTLGEVTEERGFKEALVILGGELVPTLGGGACQIATTLFNAASLADLKVLQRRNHSFYFNIYPLGRDAAVYPGQLDFKFENNTKYPILIKAVANNKKLSFRIYGTPTGKKVTFSKLEILSKTRGGEYEPVSLKKVIALDIPFKTSVMRTVYDKDGQKISEEEITSSYKLYGDKDNVPIRRPGEG